MTGTDVKRKKKKRKKEQEEKDRKERKREKEKEEVALHSLFNHLRTNCDDHFRAVLPSPSRQAIRCLRSVAQGSRLSEKQSATISLADELKIYPTGSTGLVE